MITDSVPCSVVKEMGVHYAVQILHCVLMGVHCVVQILHCALMGVHDVVQTLHCALMGCMMLYRLCIVH